MLRTSPIAESVIGYRGWTDTLVAFDPALHIVGVRVRSSQDTSDHVHDVRDDRYFMKTWNGKPWDEVARRSPEEMGIEGVSGASMTSMAMAEGIMRRLRAADAALAERPPTFRWTWIDVGLAVIVLTGTVLVFTGTYGRKWLRIGFQILVIGYVGFLAGVPLAQSLFVGWSQSGAPWRTAPGMVLLLAAALAVPWVSRKPLYCQQLCPHGAAQELLGRVAPKRWRLNIPKNFGAGLRWLPGLTLGLVIIVTIIGLPIDLAHLEPFDAYSLRAAGLATMAIAGVGLIASLFVPMAYCHYGCPTGALLEFIRSHGPATALAGAISPRWRSSRSPGCSLGNIRRSMRGWSRAFEDGALTGQSGAAFRESTPRCPKPAHLPISRSSQSYCTTFLKPEMRHIYRQVTGLRHYRTFVMTRERMEEKAFPFSDIEVIRRARKNFLKRFFLKYVRRLPPVYYRGELQVLIKTLKRRPADLMHVYFGHTGVHLLPFIKEWDKPCVVSFHGMDIQPRPQQEGFDVQMQELLQTVPLVLARSKSLMLGLEGLGCPPEKLRLNRTGIPLEQFPFQQRPMPADGSWRFVQACRLIAKKGLKTALRAFAQFHMKCPKAKFCIAATVR